MAVTAGWYGLALRDQWGTNATDRVDFMTDVMQCSLHTSSYTIDPDANDYFNDATNELPTAGGYTANGVTLASKALTYDTGTNETRFDAADAAWTSATFTARSAVVWKNSAGASTTDHLFTWVNFGGDETVSAANFTIQWDSVGIAKIVS